MFDNISDEITSLVAEWENRLLHLSTERIENHRNTQNRTIKEIVGHMVDSASNNTHRVIHLQYREIPLRFPNYATYGNNNKWISIQNYQSENWKNLVYLWKYTHLHFVHIIQNINPENMNNEWFADINSKITLKAMVEDFPRHFKLHLNEITELIAD